MKYGASCSKELLLSWREKWIPSLLFRHALVCEGHGDWSSELKVWVHLCSHKCESKLCHARCKPDTDVSVLCMPPALQRATFFLFSNQQRAACPDVFSVSESSDWLGWMSEKIMCTQIYHLTTSPFLSRIAHMWATWKSGSHMKSVSADNIPAEELMTYKFLHTNNEIES